MGQRKLPAGDIMAVTVPRGTTVTLPARRHYDAIISAKPVSEWQPSELTLAEKLANAITLYERMESQSAVTPLIVDSPNGPKPHPLFGMLKNQAGVVLGLRRALFRRDNPSGVITLPQEAEDDLL
jgi:hypothetical protein